MRPTERFTETVQDYLKYRPQYPDVLVPVLKKAFNLSPQWIIADIGAGTGFLTRHFLDAGCKVYAIEPNQTMRSAAEEWLNVYDNFVSVNATAEKTTLATASVNLITVGTAFHWFETDKAKREFLRLLKTPGYAAMIWNIRDLNHPLMEDYEQLLKHHCESYTNERAEIFDKSLDESFFAPYKMHQFEYPFYQTFDWEGFRGRLHSTSYAKRQGMQGYDAMIVELRDIFTKYEVNGHVCFYYLCKMYYGQMK